MQRRTFPRSFVRIGCGVAVALWCVTTPEAAAAGRTKSAHGRAHHARHKSARPSPRPKSAASTACIDAYRQAMEKEKGGQLRAARDSLAECAQSQCNKTLREQCLVRHTQIEGDIPSVVPVVTDHTGAPRVDIEVKVDGEPLTSRLDGNAIALDPGVHEFSFRSNGDVFATQKLMILQGQRNRPISASLRASDRRVGNLSMASAAPTASAPKVRADSPPTVARKADDTSPSRTTVAAATGFDSSPPAPPKARDPESEGTTNSEDPVVSQMADDAGPPRRSVLPYVLAGVGVAAVGGFGLATYWGRQDNASLAACAPNCMQSSVDHIDRLYLIANISLGVGIAALGTAAVLWATSSRSSAATEEASAKRISYRMGVRPTSSGAFADFSGSF